MKSAIFNEAIAVTQDVSEVTNSIVQTYGSDKLFAAFVCVVIVWFWFDWKLRGWI